MAGVAFMQNDNARIEDTVLAILDAVEFDNGRTWKWFDFDVMGALVAKGLISDPPRMQEPVHPHGSRRDGGEVAAPGDVRSALTCPAGR
jgi:hypothetical protein